MRLAFALAAMLVLSASASASANASPRSADGAVAPVATVAQATIPRCPADAGVMDGWSDRAPPRRVFGNVYYVGTCGITALLVTSPQGHVLLDGTTETAGPLVAANIQALGFKLGDVKAILNSHAHFDHAGGLAYLQHATGAPVIVRAPSAATLERGASAGDDPQTGALEPVPPVANVRMLPRDSTVRVAALALTAHATPGHTPGSTTWTWMSCEGSRCLHMVYADSLSAVSAKSYRFSDHMDYVAAFRRSIAAVASLPCDILLTPHPLASDLFARLDGTAPLVDSSACRRYADGARDNLEQRLRDETNHGP